MAIKTLRPLSRLREPSTIDSVRYAKKHIADRRAFEVLMEAQHHWDNMYQFRKDRERNKRYAYGDQWGDLIRDVDTGAVMTEEKYIRTQGSEPLKNNLIRRLIRNVTGVYRSQDKEPTCYARDREEQHIGETMSTVLQYNMQLNRMNEIYSRSFEEFLISGFIAHRKYYGWKHDKLDCWTDYVQPNNFFIDCNMRDFRGDDCQIVGEIHDLSFETVCERFAQSMSDYEKLRQIYHHAQNRIAFSTSFADFGSREPDTYDFLMPKDQTRCRVIEVWRKETKPRYRCHDYLNGDVYKIDVEDYQEEVVEENRRRMEQGVAAGMPPDDVPQIEATWIVDAYWYYYFLTPFGDVLAEGETPYAHKSHPYVFKAFPFIDGEIHSFVADVIDQQRYTNRLITMYDWIMRASAKGVLMVPEDCVGNLSPQEFADEWSRFNGVIFYKPSKSGQAPQQIANNSVNIGISELLNIQLKFFEDISGVHGALQGRSATSGTSGKLYQQQAQNATMSLLDMLDCFANFTQDAAYKDVKNIQQFYDTKRVINIAGKNAIVEYDPEKIRDVEFDLSITDSQTSPAYRDMANEFLMQIWQSNQISLQQLLQFGNFPFADDLLQSLQSQQEQITQGRIPEDLSPAMQQQVQQGADMNAVNQAYQAIRPQ